MAGLYFDEEEAVEALQNCGYRVIKLDLPESSSVTSIKGLVDYFYACRLYYNQDRKFPNSRNFKEDTKYITTFVKKRQKLGLSKKFAVQEAVVLIETLFKFEKHLKLRTPVMSPVVLGLDFIMDRICAYANGEIDEVNEMDTEMFIDKMNKVYDKKFAERDSQRAAIGLERILEKINECK